VIVHLIHVGPRHFNMPTDHLNMPTDHLPWQAHKPVVNFGWIGATMSFGYCFMDPIEVEFPRVISASLQADAANVFQLPHCRRILRENARQVTAWCLLT
jgi:hypothetical protein